MIQEQNSPREDKHQLCGSVRVCVHAHMFLYVCLCVLSALWLNVQLDVHEILSEVCVRVYECIN